ncbi:Holliday junction resolvase RuvX [Aquimarina brevivitae]|uniref:Putative pre-16S rRNA nuclease n=1 Tax=Aquimarina brevivitae TaxID=323412 RepID=A0A4Q7PIB7_9FLAO|nr:Holliday junction resolvase RuvX [Aquimarina brevivitae]RZT00352.1 putative Holliday junction resolvase [Aquimarina brevivitae]
MARLLAIDYGAKRCGIAVTDESQIVATGLTTVGTKELMSWLKNYWIKEEVELLVIGEPKRLHGEASDIESAIQEFIQQLQKEIEDISIVRVDERFTSKMAFEAMIQSGISKKKRRNKALIDEMSAAIILQDYLYNQK